MCEAVYGSTCGDGGIAIHCTHNGIPEIAREIPDTIGLYWAGDRGNIYRMDSSAVSAEKGVVKLYTVATRLNRAGYKRFTANLKGVKVNLDVHRAVAMAWHGKGTRKYWLVRHLDGNKLNNAPSNLRWGTASQNARDRVRHARMAAKAATGAANA